MPIIQWCDRTAACECPDCMSEDRPAVEAYHTFLDEWEDEQDPPSFDDWQLAQAN